MGSNVYLGNGLKCTRMKTHNVRLNKIVIPQYSPALEGPAPPAHVPHPATLPLHTSLILYGIIHMCV